MLVFCPPYALLTQQGIGDGGRKDIDTAYDVMNVNVMGVMNTLRPIVDAMKERKKGQIAVVSSVAAFFEMPGNSLAFGFAYPTQETAPTLDQRQQFAFLGKP